MIKIIVDGKDIRYKATCDNCQTVFEYENSDVRRNGWVQEYPYVKCPYYKNSVIRHSHYVINKENEITNDRTTFDDPSISEIK